MTDPINPDHYRRFPVEVIEITEHLNFARGSAVKYLCRAGFKDPNKELEDLQKAAWYIQREIDRIAPAGERDRSAAGEMHTRIDGQRIWTRSKGATDQEANQ